MWLVSGLQVTEGFYVDEHLGLFGKWAQEHGGGVTVRQISARHKVGLSNKQSCSTVEKRSWAPPPSREAFKQS